MSANLPKAPEKYERQDQQETRRLIEEFAEDVRAQTAKYDVIGVTPANLVRTLDPNTATVGDIANVLATLLLDLQQKRLVS